MASAVFEFFRHLFEGKKYIPEEARRKMKPHYDAIHKYEKEIENHRKQITLIKQAYNIVD